MNLLIVYGSTEGQTRKICEFLDDKARDMGHEVTLCDSTASPESPEGFDAVILAASVHMDQYQSSVRHYARDYHEALNKSHTAFVSVSLTAAMDEPDSWKELRENTENFLEETGWYPDFTEQVAGALRYSKYNWLKKQLMRMIAKKGSGDVDVSTDYEYTDWEQVEGLLKRLINTAQ